MIFLIVTACKKLEDLNKNIKDPTKVSGESLFTGAQLNLYDQMVTPNVNFNIFELISQYWTECTYTDESNYDLWDRTIPDNHWDVLYRDVLKDLDEAGKVIKATDYPTDPSPAVKQNRLAIVDVLTVYTYMVLVETFGDVPYTQALDINNTQPKYDDGMTIYKDLISRLNNDVASMDATQGSLDLADNMYQGNVASWIKFANSLKLRMGLVLADADAALAKTTVEEAASNAGGLISSNAENAKIVYLASQPNSNPIYDNLVASGRHDFVPTSIMIDPMNNLNDPRRPFYFTLIDTSAGGTGQMAYVGGVYGLSNDFTKYSHVADKIQEPTFESILLDYAETEFLLATAAERGFTVTGTAEEHYNNGIKASINYWGGTDADATAYLAQTGVAYTTASGTYKEKIGVQMWYALYLRGFEAWTFFRLYDYPQLVAPPDALSEFPVRLTFPIEEQTLNGANYKAASTAVGGDEVKIKLFWDKN